MQIDKHISNAEVTFPLVIKGMVRNNNNHQKFSKIINNKIFSKREGLENLLCLQIGVKDI